MISALTLSPSSMSSTITYIPSNNHSGCGSRPRHTEQLPRLIHTCFRNLGGMLTKKVSPLGHVAS